MRHAHRRRGGQGGLSPALVVYYFGSKEKLLTEALAYAEDLFYIEAFRELTDIEGASERLVRLIELACPPVVGARATSTGRCGSSCGRGPYATRRRPASARRWNAAGATPSPRW